MFSSMLKTELLLNCNSNSEWKLKKWKKVLCKTLKSSLNALPSVREISAVGVWKWGGSSVHLKLTTLILGTSVKAG